MCLLELKKGLFLSYSLKRTTDVMFGGKQVVVCGYGEVSSASPHLVARQIQQLSSVHF